MKPLLRTISLIIILSFVLTACGQPTSAPTATLPPQPTSMPTVTPTQEPTTAPVTDLLYVNLIWHQHQPLYYKDENGVYTRPWVRVHATKDYYDMASTVANYPNVHITFNLTPVLLRQLDDFINGAKDQYWVLAEKPANSLSDDDKKFILQRFFDTNGKIVDRFPRYKELLNKRGGSDDAAIAAAMKSFSEQDFRDLQIWFNLAWFDPDFQAQEPLKSLVAKGKDFSEDEKKIVFNKTLEIIKGIVPLHKQLQDKGQIEVITTPYSHPILPLLIDSDLAKVGNPSTELPPRFQYPQDALAQLQKSVEIYKNEFGQAPRGLWPGEGSVAQAIVPYVLKTGYQWMATGEPVLAQSLGIDQFQRDSKETVTKADDLYRPYYVMNKAGDKLAVFFRDGVISDKIGFTYSGLPGNVAAKDLILRLENIRAELKKENAQGPHIVSIILDGENAWENYANDGKDFLNGFYQLLNDSKDLKAVTPSEYLKLFPEQREIKDLFPGAWFSPNYDTWIGEPEENLAWDYLGKVRADLGKYDITKTRTASPEAIAKAEDFIYLAEGSDWFWWFGADQDSGQDWYFDQAFRALLAGVYQSLGEPVPTFVNVPIIQSPPVSSATPLNGLSTPIIDGVSAAKEWDNAATYPAQGQSPITDLAYTMDKENLYFRVTIGESLQAVKRIGFYFLAPRATASYPFARPEASEPSQLLGFAATNLFEWTGNNNLKSYLPTDKGWEAKEDLGRSAANGTTIEFAIPLKSFGELTAGDELRLVLVSSPQNQVVPSKGPVQIIMPDLGNSTVILDVADPMGDDHGPGTYTYPTDGVFQSKAFDLKSFKVSFDQSNIIFKFGFVGPIPNPWGSPNNLAIQTLDVYVDKDPGAGTGARLLLPGRNAALKAGDGWDVALWAEGWTPGVVRPDATGAPVVDAKSTFKIIVDAGQRTVTLRVPKETFGGGDPSKWGYVAAVMGQEGYPATGVWRIRDINAKAEQWRFGGAADDVNHTRIIDLIWPADQKPSQEDMLGKYTSSKADIGTLKPDDFAQVGELVVK